MSTTARHPMDCGDSGCVWRHRDQPSGQRTNGGCKCLRPMSAKHPTTEERVHHARELRRAKHYVFKLSKDVAALRQFACRIMRAWPEGDVDGFDLQDAAIEHGLLVGVEVTEPCNEGCRCADYHGDLSEGVTCYRPTALLTGEGER